MGLPSSLRQTATSRCTRGESSMTRMWLAKVPAFLCSPHSRLARGVPLGNGVQARTSGCGTGHGAASDGRSSLLVGTARAAPPLLGLGPVPLGFQAPLKRTHGRPSWAPLPRLPHGGAEDLGEPVAGRLAISPLGPRVVCEYGDHPVAGPGAEALQKTGTQGVGDGCAAADVEGQLDPGGGTIGVLASGPARGVETPVQLVGRDDDVCGDPERLSWAHFGESAGAEEVAGCMAGECR
jgi:hypothetical protein